MTRLLCVLALLSLVSGSALAATDLHDASGTFTGLLDLIRQSANGWSGRLRGFATSLFWSLAVISFVMTMIPLIFKGADIGEIMGEMFRFIMVIGFFASLLLYSVDWAEAIVNSFRQAGSHAAGVGNQIYPGDMFALAVELAKTVGDVDTWNPMVAGTVGIAAVVVLLCFTFIAAFMGLTLVESYIVINASVLFMGFGGSQWTREYAISMMRYALSVGAKLFVLTLIVGLVLESAKQWQSAYNMQQDEASMWTMVGLALICAYLSKSIPDLIQALINGVSTGGGSIIGGMAAAGVAGAAAAMATMSSAIGASSFLSGGGAAKGVADLVGSSLSGGVPGAAGAASSMASSAMNGAASALGGGSRVGGGAGSSSASPGTGQPPAGGMGKAQKAANMAHKAASGAMRGGGVLSAMSVPGMEGVADLSMGPPPVPLDGDMPDSGSVQDTPENIIRPESAQDSGQAIDTASSVKDAINSRGKP